MDINTEANRKILINLFPLLGNDQHYSLLSEATPVYNCIAWAMGYNDRWIDTYHSPGHWWPDGVHSRNVFTNSLYGDEFAYLRRPITKKTLGGMAYGAISVHMENLKL